jgi:DNA-binding PadR family transcriptional regulator
LEKGNFFDNEMKSTMLKVRILRRMGKSEVNSYALLKEFTKSGKFSSFFGTSENMKNEVYNTIKSLEKSKYIKSSQKIENGRLKNYYTLTGKGKLVLKSTKHLFQKHLKNLALLFNE